MRLLRYTILTAIALLAAGALARADDAPPADTPVEKAVDHFIDAKLKAAGVTPAPRANDANLIRRLTLDLVGRIPTVSETKAFVESEEADKAAKLVDRLLASSGYVRHQANELNVMLMAGTRGNVREYLTQALTEGRPWDQMFRELVLPNETDAKQKGAGEFLRQRIADLDKATSDVSVVFFGVNISCARCHDHPRVEDWKQDHFFGLKAFLNRTFDNGGFLAEREYGEVKFKTVKGQDKTARLMFLTGLTLDEDGVKEPSKEEQKKEKEQYEAFKKNKQAPPPAKNSVRARLVELALQEGQRDFFARSIANRLWARLMGHGLVNPLDQMHAANPPSHPELLEWLANDVVAHGYDLKRLMRGLVLSETYARTSRWETEDAPKSSLFALAKVRPLTPHQMAASLRLATTDPQVFSAGMKPEEFEKKIESLEVSGRGLADQIEQPGEDFQISVSEALLFSNGERIQKELLVDASDRLIGRLKTIDDPKALIETMVGSVKCRPPTSDELSLMTGYLAKRQDRKVEACRQLVWALIGNSEFRFNY